LERTQREEAIALVKNGYIWEIGVATERAQAVLKRENLLCAIEQAEKPFAWRHRLRTEREYMKKRSWNDQYYKTFAPLDLARESQALSSAGSIGPTRIRERYISIQ